MNSNAQAASHAPKTARRNHTSEKSCRIHFLHVKKLIQCYGIKPDAVEIERTLGREKNPAKNKKKRASERVRIIYKQ